MEIKKYVLLKNNTIVKFYKNDKFGFAYVEKEQDGIIFTRSALPSDVKLTSDNILDLVEVGDMVMRDDDFCYHIIVTDISKDTFYGEHESIWRGNRISHLWKRQQNGDYKRYEVV